ncbi:helix-turn-helix transcriptional regulator [Dactylosporangium sp. NPDC051484]|uniref:helix-turn-helix domain-containing protein n=1 Tax=Dactylosporangium sp. NPDC051484 TaxID=3154942 RepID=UPI00344BAB5D
MSSGDTPAVARRKVRLAIKDARNAKGDTQTQVAEAMEWSLSKVMRIESGEVTISQNDLRPLLAYLGIRDRKVAEELVQAAKASKQRRQWWDDKRYQGRLTSAMRQLIGFEAEASVIRSFAPQVIPGWLQGQAYALAVTQGFTEELRDDEIETRAAIRVERRKALWERNPRPRLYALFDESVLLRGYGGPQALRKSLAEISTSIAEGRVTVRIHPLELPYPPFGQYDLMYLSNEENSHAVLYRESGTLDEIVDDPARIARHREAWDRMWESSIGEEDSARKIAAAAIDPAAGADTRFADKGSSD